MSVPEEATNEQGCRTPHHSFCQLGSPSQSSTDSSNALNINDMHPTSVIALVLIRRTQSSNAIGPWLSIELSACPSKTCSTASNRARRRLIIKRHYNAVLECSRGLSVVIASKLLGIVSSRRPRKITLHLKEQTLIDDVLLSH